jgi:hypothetical protein
VTDRSNASGATSPADDPIGSLGQETVKLFRAIAAERMRSHDSSGDPADLDTDATADTAAPDATVHVCTTGWCPICQLVGYVQDHPELVDQVTETVTDAAIQVGRVLRDFLDKTVPPEK